MNHKNCAKMINILLLIQIFTTIVSNSNAAYCLKISNCFKFSRTYLAGVYLTSFPLFAARCDLMSLLISPNFDKARLLNKPWFFYMCKMSIQNITILINTFKIFLSLKE